VIECTPNPAAEGLKTPPETPGPLYAPPEGVPPASVKEPELIQTSEIVL